MAWNQIILTLTGLNSRVLPEDFNPYNNYVECLGAGANGGAGYYDGGGNGNQSDWGGYGGGGGAYSRKNNLAVYPSSIIYYSIGLLAADTWFNGVTFLASSCGAKGASVTSGGQASACIGDVNYSGGNGGWRSYYVRCGGGGGAAGPNGAGTNGASLTGLGGNANGGLVLAPTTHGSAGNYGSEWGIGYGCGSGGCGWSDDAYGGQPGGEGGRYGGGGGGGGLNGPGGAGQQGLIVITYFPLQPGALLIGLT